MRRALAILLCGFPVFSARTAEPVFLADFEGARPGAAWGGWDGGARIVESGEGGQALEVATAPGGPPTRLVHRPLPLDELRGARLRCEAMVRAYGVTEPPNAWNGIKFMLRVQSPAGDRWAQQNGVWGTFDWKRIRFLASVPADATAVTLYLGLESAAGTARFDRVRITRVAAAPAPPPRPPEGPVFKGHDVPRLRGAMVGPDATEDDLRELGRGWKANLIRWQLINHPRPNRRLAPEQYDAWLDRELGRLDRVLGWCEQYGLLAVIDLHSPPGGKGTISGYAGTDDALFTDRAAQDKFVAIWRRIAARYRDRRAVWGYDLANEPVEEYVEEGCDDWRGLAARAAKAIREIDPARAIVVEAPPWGSPESLRDFVPIEVSNVVYSCHMYVPSEFTHQGVFRHTTRSFAYPGAIDGVLWDKAALEQALQPVVEFQKRYNVHIYIGEFSAIRWAPDESAFRYLRDVIDIFEDHGWDWSYHAFREWDGWSVEHGPDRQDPARSRAPTRREELLKSWYAKNRRFP